MAGIKEMAPLFVVFDRPTYRKLIPHHLTEILLMPKEVLTHLQMKGSVLTDPCIVRHLMKCMN